MQRTVDLGPGRKQLQKARSLPLSHARTFARSLARSQAGGLPPQPALAAKGLVVKELTGTREKKVEAWKNETAFAAAAATCVKNGIFVFGWGLSSFCMGIYRKMGQFGGFLCVLFLFPLLNIPLVLIF